MRIFASRRSLGIVLLCAHLASTGCHRWVPVEQAGASSGLVRVHLRSGGNVDGQVIRATGDSLYIQQAAQAGAPILAVPSSQVERIERRAFSPARTTAYGAAIAVGAFAIVAAILSFVQSQNHKVY